MPAIFFLLRFKEEFSEKNKKEDREFEISRKNQQIINVRKSRAEDPGR